MGFLFARQALTVSCDYAAGAPERLCVLMEGESLFNDSSSIVLFKIFFDMVKRLAQGRPGSQLGMGAEVLSIAGNILWLSFGPLNGFTHPSLRRSPTSCIRSLQLASTRVLIPAKSTSGCPGCRVPACVLTSLRLWDEGTVPL